MKSKANNNYSIIILTYFSWKSLFLSICPKSDPYYWYSSTKYTNISSSYISYNLKMLSHSSRAQWTLIS